MSSVNLVVLMGNLTRDPELRYLPQGQAVCEFGIALNRKFGDAANPQEEVTFVDVTAWSAQAESVSKYLTKGSQCVVEGRLRMESWTDKQTSQNRTKLKVVANHVTFTSGGERKEAVTAPAPAVNNVEEKDDLPF